ncbi:MAG: hypothetical protein ACREE7_00400 [Dongiaceae bacterium]
MAQSELSTRRGDDTAELRARYNQLCAALTMSAGTNSAVADRVLQELQSLAQKIAFRQAERDSASRPPVGAAPASAAPRTEARPAHGKGNVIAFRCRVKGRARENPRLPAALSALTDRTPVAPFESSPERPQAVAPTPAPKAQAAPPTPTEPPMAAAVAEQGAELQRLVRKSEDQTRILESLEGRLGKSEDAPQLSAEVAALRSAAARQGEQLVSLATAVHRLAKLLAAHPPQDRR